jgi:uncharacterized protein (DUF3820 family)
MKRYYLEKKTVKQKDMAFPFGKYKGKLICEVPTSYLHFLQDQDWFIGKFKDMAEQVQIELNYRDKWGFESEDD